MILNSPGVRSLNIQDCEKQEMFHSNSNLKIEK